MQIDAGKMVLILEKAVDILNISIAIPTIEEQQKITDIF